MSVNVEFGADYCDSGPVMGGQLSQPSGNLSAKVG